MVSGEAETRDPAFLDDAASIRSECEYFQYLAQLCLLKQQLAWISLVLGKSERCVVKHKVLHFNIAVIRQCV